MGEVILQSVPAARGSHGVRNPAPGLQSLQGAKFDFDYSRLARWEGHTARSVMRIVTSEQGQATV